MTMEQQHEVLKQQLITMGYTTDQAESAVTAGIKDINQAVDYISNESAKIINHFPSLSDAHLSTSATSLQPGSAPESQFRNARDSLDGIHGTRHSNNHTMTNLDAITDTQMNKDSAIERVMEISLQEQEDREIAQTIKMSREDQPLGPQPQDQLELNRAIEESLKEKDNAMAQARQVSWQAQGYEDVNGQPRKSLDEPVGLRNIGNTCYLNSLLQVYYHLPDFRQAIMSFRAPEQFTNVSYEAAAYQSAPVPYQQPVIEEAREEEVDENISPQERLERNIAASQLPQSWVPAGGEPLSKVPDGMSGMSDNHADVPQQNPAEVNAVLFVVELQKLFAAMALGDENCADPSGVAHTMRHPNGDPITIGAQQDADEFNHLFLDIVEKGLKTEKTHGTSGQGDGTDSLVDHGGKAPPDAMEESAKDSNIVKDMPPDAMEERAKDSNIVKDMFTVQFRQELLPGPSGSSAHSEEEPRLATVRQGETSAIVVNATAKDYRNLHSGLDDYAYAQIDYEVTEPLQGDATGTDPAARPQLQVSDHSNARESTTAFKSVWFTRMPPVVVIYLQRATFNKEKSQAEKVHLRYDFPCEISFDRYLEENKDASMRARGIVQQIRGERERVTALLKQVHNFPLGRPQQCQNNYISNGVVDMDVSEPWAPDQNPQQNDRQMERPETCSVTHGAEEQAEIKESIFDAADRVHARLFESLNSSSELFAVDGLSKERVEASLSVLKAVMDHDRKNCDDFESNLRALKAQEERAFEGLDKKKYRLHAVLVHDGAPSGGHYWTFIRNWNSTSNDLTWMRLSDSSVSFVSEEDMLSWSVGGRSRASAYCLIYADEGSLDKYKTRESISEESKRLLPSDRIDEVIRASRNFASEMEDEEPQGK